MVIDSKWLEILGSIYGKENAIVADMDDDTEKNYLFKSIY